jgi:hypothetical protein
MVLRGGADHGRATNVDVLDRFFERSLAGDRFLERVEIADEKVDANDAMLLHGAGVAFLVTQREQAPMHLGMQRLEAAVHHFGEARHGRNVGDPEAGCGQRLGRAAGRNKLDAAGRKGAGEFHEACLVRDGNKGPAYLPETGNRHLTRTFLASKRARDSMARAAAPRATMPQFTDVSGGSPPPVRRSDHFTLPVWWPGASVRMTCWVLRTWAAWPR